MFVLGITGSIAMGKSYVARRLRCLNVPVFDSDAAVHRLYQAGSPMVREIDDLFPGCLNHFGSVDRLKLAKVVLGDHEALRKLESLVHPWTFHLQRQFLMKRSCERWPTVGLDIPLLFETNGQKRMDATLVVETSTAIQTHRALRRPGMTQAKLKTILAKQMSPFEKRKRADFVVQSGFDRSTTTEALTQIIRNISMRPGHAWPRLWS